MQQSLDLNQVSLALCSSARRHEGHQGWDDLPGKLSLPPPGRGPAQTLDPVLVLVRKGKSDRVGPGSTSHEL